MANDLDLLQEKWRVWFKMLDVNHDGSLTLEDWTQGAETLIREHNLNEKHAEVAMASYHRLGALLLGESMKDKKAVTVDQFVDNLTSFYKEDSQKAEKYIFSVIRQLFLVTDVNRDALISQEEFSIMMKSFGIKPEKSRQFYEELPRFQSNKVPMQDAINWWVDLWFGTDASKWQAIKPMFD